MLTALDLWLGRRVFVPLVIWFCRLTGVTQHAVSRVGWWIVILQTLYVWKWSGWSAVFGTLYLLFGVAQTISVGINPNRTAVPVPWIRRFALIMILIAVIPGIAIHLWRGDLQPRALADLSVSILILIAEWAATITTIPPAELKVRAPSGRLARQSG